MKEWKEYTKDRVICLHPDDFYIIVPKERQKKHPIFCPVCDHIMRTGLDEISFKKFECCDSCATFWAYPNKEKWLTGWRPSPDEVSNKYNIRHT